MRRVLLSRFSGLLGALGRVIASTAHLLVVERSLAAVGQQVLTKASLLIVCSAGFPAVHPVLGLWILRDITFYP